MRRGLSAPLGRGRRLARPIVVRVWGVMVWLRPWLFDGAVSASVATLVALEYRLPWSIRIFGLLMALALIWRRHRPVTVMAIVYTLAPAHLLFHSYVRLFDVAVLIAMYAVVLYRPQLHWGVLAGAGATLGVVVAAAVENDRSDNFWAIIWVVGAVTVTTWVTAYGVRTRRLYVTSLEERAATLQRERDHLALLAVADERAAIAREVHDVVAHSLSVMIVQADAAGYTLQGEQRAARDALGTIAATGREALQDMSRVVRLLRGPTPHDGNGPGPAPAPVGGEPAGRVVAQGDDELERRRMGLAELDGLVERSGLRISRETVGVPGGLTAAQELVTYRIVQESLTNALRHAGPGVAVTLRLTFTPSAVRIEVRDDGGGRAAEPPTAGGAGHGLVGMRERVVMHGGELEAGPRPEGGWLVAATIPRAHGGGG